MDPDLVAAVMGVGLVLPPAFVLAPSWADAMLFSCALWIPWISLPAIRQGRPVVAAMMNAGTVVAAFQIQDMIIWRPFAACMGCVAILKSYHHATHYPGSKLTWARHYIGVILLIDVNRGRKKVPRYRDCFQLVDALSAITMVLVCYFGFGICDQCILLPNQSSNHDKYYYYGMNNWQNGFLICCRSTFACIGFGYVITALQYLWYPLLFAPAKLVHNQPTIMNQFLASTSLSEFWSVRWNQPFHGLLKRNVYQPLLVAVVDNDNNNNNNNKGGKNNGATSMATTNNKAMAGFFTFATSGILHALMLMHVPNWWESCLAFFISQGILIQVERKMFTTTTRGSWSNRIFALLSLFGTSPLLVEPLLLARQQQAAMRT